MSGRRKRKKKTKNRVWFCFVRSHGIWLGREPRTGRTSKLHQDNEIKSSWMGAQALPASRVPGKRSRERDQGNNGRLKLQTADCVRLPSETRWLRQQLQNTRGDVSQPHKHKSLTSALKVNHIHVYFAAR